MKQGQNSANGANKNYSMDRSEFVCHDNKFQLTDKLQKNRKKLRYKYVYNQKYNEQIKVIQEKLGRFYFNYINLLGSDYPKEIDSLSQKPLVIDKQMFEISEIQLPTVNQNIESNEIQGDYNCNSKENIKDEECSNENKDFAKEIENAAVKIQSLFRGYQCRKDFKTKLFNEDQKLNEAATKIQALYRGYHVRKNRNCAQNDYKRISSAIKIQSLYRGFKCRKTLKGDKHDITDTNMIKAAITIQSAFRDLLERKNKSKQFGNDVETAAIKIQSLYRGYQCRKNFKSKLSTEDQKLNEAATKIQAVYRGYNVLKNKNCTQNDYELIRSAIKIQSLYRGYKCRKTLKGEKFDDNDINMIKAAITIQSAYREFLERQNKSKTFGNDVETAALKIQSLYRGYQCRKNFKCKLFTEDQKLNEAATKIQALYRGYHVRKNRNCIQNDYELISSAIKIQSLYRGL
ncbi:Abnormal spindle-like microcephaly-associated protein-like [Armadillidium vulgare]|nr:Abnormal spindle-like microcephaly-associated protein-like [Armadillidium vulgare]